MNQYRRGLITNEERYDRVICIWSKAKDDITKDADEIDGSLQLHHS